MFRLDAGKIFSIVVMVRPGAGSAGKLWNLIYWRIVGRGYTNIPHKCSRTGWICLEEGYELQDLPGSLPDLLSNYKLILIEDSAGFGKSATL